MILTRGGLGALRSGVTCEGAQKRYMRRGERVSWRIDGRERRERGKGKTNAALNARNTNGFSLKNQDSTSWAI